MRERIKKAGILLATIFAIMAIVSQPAFAKGGKVVFDDGAQKLTLNGDLRYRYEMDNNNTKSAPDSEDRTRQRIRLRFGAKFKASDAVEAGFRLASGAGSLHSPHNDLGQVGTQSENQDFGVDKAYVKYNRDAFWLWAGKNSLPIKQLSSTWFEGDFNPEGIVAGYKTKNLSLSLANFIIQANGNHAANDSAMFLGANYKTKVSGIGLKLVGANLAVDESSRDAGDSLTDVPGGDANYTYLGLEGKSGIFSIGGEYMTGDAKEAERGGSGIAKSSDKTGMVIYAKVKLNQTFGIRAYSYDLGYASIPLLGGWGADDFPYTSNYTGTRLQLDIDTGLGMKIDVRLYNMETKNKNLTSVASNTDALKAKSAGTAAKIARTQINFNVAF